MKIVAAEEKDGMVIATVRFSDGMDQTVIAIADGCTKQKIKDEAKRLRRSADQERIKRPDLTE